ncbi:MAG: hypothetical protein KJ880_03745, partial [Candidatus Omnitrophica bacterium]|nr:hypothetical protein [Candidatus Omnitrophota bacterium]
IFIYVVSTIIGLLGFAKFNVTAKGLNIGWIRAFANKNSVYDIPEELSGNIHNAFAKSLSFNGRWILATTVWLDLLSLAMFLQPWLAGLKLLAFIPFVLAILTPFLCRLFFTKQLRAELWPEDVTKVTPVKVALIMNIPLLVPVIAGVFFWRNPQLIWSITYLLAPIVTILVFFFYQPALGTKILKYKMASSVAAVLALVVVEWLAFLIGGYFAHPIIGVVVAPLLILWLGWELLWKELIDIYGTSKLLCFIIKYGDVLGDKPRQEVENMLWQTVKPSLRERFVSIFGDEAKAKQGLYDEVKRRLPIADKEEERKELKSEPSAVQTGKTSAPAAEATVCASVSTPQVHVASPAQTAELEAVLSQILKESLPPSLAPPAKLEVKVTQKDALTDVEINQVVPEADQDAVKKSLLDKIAKGDIVIKVQDPQGKEAVIPVDRINIRFASIHIEFNNEGKTKAITISYKDNAGKLATSVFAVPVDAGSISDKAAADAAPAGDSKAADPSIKAEDKNAPAVGNDKAAGADKKPEVTSDPAVNDVSADKEAEPKKEEVNEAARAQAPPEASAGNINAVGTPEQINSLFEQISQINRTCFERGFRDFGEDATRDDIIRRALQGDNELFIGIEGGGGRALSYIVFGPKDGAVYVYYLAAIPGNAGRIASYNSFIKVILAALDSGINTLTAEVSKHNTPVIKLCDRLKRHIPEIRNTDDNPQIEDRGDRLFYRYALEQQNSAVENNPQNNQESLAPVDTKGDASIGNKSGNGAVVGIIGMLSALPFLGGCTTGTVVGGIAGGVVLSLVMAAVLARYIIANRAIVIGRFTNAVDGLKKASVVLREENRFAQGKVVRIDPSKIVMGIWVGKDSVEYDFSRFARSPEFAKQDNKIYREFPGRTVAQFVSDEKVPFAVNGHQGNFYLANTLVIIDGKLIRKPVPDIKHDNYVQLTGKYFFLVLDQDNIGIREINIKNDQPQEDISSIKCALSGPVLVRGGKDVSEEVIFSKKPLGNNEVTWDPKKASFAFSLIGKDKNGRLVQVSMAGNPTAKGTDEAMLSDIREVAARLKLEDAIILGTSMDVQQYVEGSSLIEAEARKGSVDQKVPAAQKAPARSLS